MMCLLKNIIVLCFLMGTFSVYGNSTFEEGIESYNNKDYSVAADKFDSIVSISPENRGAVFNLGMARLQNKEYGKAIFAFEQILKFNPNDTEAKDNIRECYFQLDPNYYWEYRLNGFQSILYSISPNTWAVFSILSSLLIAFMIVLFVKNNSPTLKRTALLTGFIFTIILLFSLITGYFSKQHKTNHNFAIVLNKEAQTFGNENEDLIHEGELLECESCETDTILFKTMNHQEVKLLKEEVGFI